MRSFGLALALLLGASVSIVHSQERVKYTLSRTDIDSVVCQLSLDSTYSVFIRLDSSASSKLKEITSNNLGNILMVFYKNRLLTEAKVMAEISSGIISVDNIKDRLKALQLMKFLQNCRGRKATPEPRK